MDSALAILKKYWNHSEFRSLQKEIIDAVLNHENVLTLLPTGAGKSLCFQIPALLQDGVCIVISPLIALMEDQVMALKKKGIKAIALTSKYSEDEAIQAFDNLIFGDFKFLYISPEKLQSEFIQEKISQLPVNLIAIDEVHCISQWGHDFRPAYLKIPILKELHPEVNFIALTASATPQVLEDITENLQLDNLKVFKKSFERNNLVYHILKTERIFDKLQKVLLNFTEPVIIYTNTRKSCIQISNYLISTNFKSNYYHGGLTNDEKLQALMNWTNETYPIMVATNAFGMGIDKANVRTVIHMHIPSSIENYMQEVGRAGRDQKKSFAFLLYNEHTIFESEEFLTKGIADPAFCSVVYIKLNQYFEISPGEFSDNTFAFNLQDFCTKYQLPILKTFNAISTFENENILEIQQFGNKKSSLKIIVSNRYLFDYEKSHPKLEKLLKIILRNYGGTFEQFIAINEGYIAKKLQLPKYQTIQLLQQLQDDKIILYNKSNNNAQLRFLVPREDAFAMHQISRNITSKNTIKIKKLKDVIEYVTNNTVCRNIQLLTYFGEKNSQKCGLCDVCASEKKKNKKNDFQEIAIQILKLFDKNNELTADDIFQKLAFDEKNILKTLELLVEKNALRITLQNKFEKVTS